MSEKAVFRLAGSVLSRNVAIEAWPCFKGQVIPCLNQLLARAERAKLALPLVSTLHYKEVEMCGSGGLVRLGVLVKRLDRWGQSWIVVNLEASIDPVLKPSQERVHQQLSSRTVAMCWVPSNLMRLPSFCLGPRLDNFDSGSVCRFSIGRGHCPWPWHWDFYTCSSGAKVDSWNCVDQPSVC